MEGFNWSVLIIFAIAMYLISPRLKREHRGEQFFSAQNEKGQDVGLLLLTCSLLISWIFAKSIQNAANLGQSFGAPGGAAYAAYWLAFIVAGVVIYQIRGQGFKSLHDFLNTRFGRNALWLFSLILLFRLWNEIWSNTMVVAQFFGEKGSTEFYMASWATTALVLFYALKSGLRSSIITDLIQMALAAVLLIIILGFILPQTEVKQIMTSGEWTLIGCVDLILVALIQIWSYPFHDPVMTDRGFITKRKVMLKAFILAGIFGVLFIFLFSFVGIYNRIEGIGGNSTINTAMQFGLPLLIFMNMIMLTSAASTIDSTFTSTGKLVAVDLFPGFSIDKVRLARLTMIVLAILGNLMVHANPTILSATTISGTMVIGLTPIFILNRWERAGKVSYYASVIVGLLFGLLLATKNIPFTIGEGKYGALLWANVVGVSLSIAVYVVAAYIWPSKAVRDVRNGNEVTA
ncbi:MAG: sodium:solute symporter [Gammaproteobacteria bacterium]|jgi:Na+/proline symporter